MSYTENDHQEVQDALEDFRAAYEGLKDILVRHCRQNDRNGMIERLKAYTFPHIEMSISDDHGFIGSNPQTLEDAVKSLQDEVEEEEDEEEEDEDVEEEIE